MSMMRMQQPLVVDRLGQKGEGLAQGPDSREANDGPCMCPSPCRAR